MMEDIPPPGTKGPDTWAPPDPTLRGGTRVVALGAMMSRLGLMGLTTRFPEGLMVVDRLTTTCRRGLMDPGPTFLTVQ